MGKKTETVPSRCLQAHELDLQTLGWEDFSFPHCTLVRKAVTNRAQSITHFSEFSVRNHLMTGPILITIVPADPPRHLSDRGCRRQRSYASSLTAQGVSLPIMPPGACLRELTSVLSMSYLGSVMRKINSMVCLKCFHREGSY